MLSTHRVSIVLAAMLLLGVAAPALAKEGMQATLDAPIGRDTPAGTVLSVGMTVTVLDGSVLRAVEGSPIYLRLIGPDGTATRALGREDGGVRGHYTMQIAIPAGGVARVEIGIHGSDDLPIAIAGEPLVSGGISPSTAQAASPLAPAITPFPRAATVPGMAAVPVEAPLPEGTPSVASIGMLAVAAALVLGCLAAVGLTARRSRSRVRPAAPPRAPGA